MNWDKLTPDERNGLVDDIIFNADRTANTNSKIGIIIRQCCIPRRFDTFSGLRFMFNKKIYHIQEHHIPDGYLWFRFWQYREGTLWQKDLEAHIASWRSPAKEQYAQKMDSAMKVIDRLGLPWLMQGDNKVVTCRFLTPKPVEATAKKPAEAICLAALKVKKA